MFLFDTNSFKLLLQGNTAVVRRAQEHAGQLWLSSVAAEELIAVHMNTMNKARAPRTSLSLSRAHTDFVETLADLRSLPILAFGEVAAQVYATLPAKAIRSGSQDSRIAAQALAHGMTVITRNISDFAAIGAAYADWSA